MSEQEPFSCYIISDDKLAIQCAEIILAAKQNLLGIISDLDSVKKWCHSRRINYIKSLDEFTKNHVNKFDYLFSIINSKILPAELLNLPQRLSINYHDSPLPKYAGLHATSWAILNNEQYHSVSWHIMTETVDAGDILKQPQFKIDKNETALTLNLKCYEQAIKSFQELTEELASNRISRTTQNLAYRSYFGLYDKPHCFGFIDWNDDAEKIDRLCRALTFGNYPNRLCSPKFILTDQIFTVISHRILTTRSGKRPGTITKISENSIQIATASLDITISEIAYIDGSPCNISEIISEHDIQANYLLKCIDKKIVKKFEEYSSKVLKYENFWVKKLSRLEPEELSFLPNSNELQNTRSSSIKLKNIPEKLVRQLKITLGSKYSLKDCILTTIMVFFYRLNNYNNFLIELCDTDLKEMTEGLEQLISTYLPFTVELHEDMTLYNVMDSLQKEKDILKSKFTYQKDIKLRYPKLKNIYQSNSIAINIVKPSEKLIPKSDSMINIFIDDNGIKFTIDCHVNCSHQPSLQYFLNDINKHFINFLRNIVQNPNNTVKHLPMMTKRQKNKIISHWNNTRAKYEHHKLIHQIFEEQVNKTPNLTAVVFENQKLTFSELNEKANKLAYHLRTIGISPNMLVAILIERSLEMVIAILATLKSGAAYIPLDPNYPKQRLSHMLEDSQAKVLLTNKTSSNKISNDYVGNLIDISKILNSANNDFSGKLKNFNKLSDIAYVIYTSGTTGQPKGVAITHRSMNNHMVWMHNEYQFNDTDVFLQKTPFSFDASVWEFFMPLLFGGTLIMAPVDAHANPMRLIDLILRNKVSILQLVPSMLDEMLLTDGFDKCTSLKNVFCGGEALLPKTIKHFFKLSTAKLHNLYGPTEATIDSTVFQCAPSHGDSMLSLIGKPINNAKTYILDTHMQPVPIGIPGELYIGGDGLAQGYLNRPELNCQRFVSNPFTKCKNKKLYKTGDLVKWQPDGNIEYLGRCDNQVKIRGFRIELNEIEATLSKHPLVHQCIVSPSKNPDGTQSLSAYLVLNKKSLLSTIELRTFLKQTLPDYMVPSSYFIVKKFLTSPSGKINRKIISDDSFQQLDRGTIHIPPQNKTEREITKIWQSVLKLSTISVEDDFFNLGGHSLAGMKIISQIEECFSIRLSIRQLFESPTIASLAKEVDNLRLIKTSQNNIRRRTSQINPIITLQSKGNKTPLFLIHPVGGSVFWYRPLARYICDRPLYAIQDPGIDTNELLFSSLEEMAEYYVKAVQSIQKSGPYLLGGASFGSTVAIEMANQLYDKRDFTEFIGLLDGWAYYPKFANDRNTFTELMRNQNAKTLAKYLDKNFKNSEFLQNLQWHREELLTKYNLPILHKFTLFKAKILWEIFQYDAPTNWWDNYSLQPIEVHSIPGDHETMFYEPNVKELAKILKQCLSHSEIQQSIQIKARQPFIRMPDYNSRLGKSKSTDLS